MKTEKQKPKQIELTEMNLVKSFISKLMEKDFIVENYNEFAVCVAEFFSEVDQKFENDSSEEKFND
jgi:hypothetical protein